MFGMKIKMNEEKILKDKKIKIEDVYALIDKEIIDKNLKIGKINKDGTRMYWGPNSKDDFGGFCMVTPSVHIHSTSQLKPTAHA